MKDNEKPKYPANLFWIGFFMNMAKRFWLFLPAIVLLIVGIWVKWCLIIGLALLLLDIIISLLEQIRIRNATLKSNNPNFTEWQDAILSPDWKDNVKDLVESQIDNHEDDSGE